MTVPEGELAVELGKEKQVLTLMVASGDGCRVHMCSYDWTNLSPSLGIVFSKACACISEKIANCGCEDV
jgi:hypothetical protein